MSWDLTFDIDNAPTNDYAPIEAGWYLASVKSAEVKDSKSGGKGVSIEFEILDERYTGRVVKNWFNVVHANEKAQQIGLGQLGDCCKACGLNGKLTSGEQIVDCHLMIKVATENSKELSPDGTPYINNVVKGYKAKGGVIKAAVKIDEDTIPF
jgi:hypothetical protein